MNAGPDVERRISDYLAEQTPTRAPDRVLPATFERTRHTRQRRFGAAWRSISMNRTWQLATAAVVGLLILGLGAAFIGGSQGGVGGPPSATPSPTPTPIPISVMKSGESGTYALDGPFVIDGITMTLPEGFAPDSGANASRVQFSISVGDTAPAWLTFNIVDEVYPDPCGAPLVAPSEPLGPTVDDLVTALRDMKGYEAGPVTDVTIGGLSAKSFELVDAADNVCEPGTLISMANGVDTNKDSYQRFVVLDVDGQRLLIQELILVPPDGATGQTYRDKIDRAIESISFD